MKFLKELFSEEDFGIFGSRFGLDSLAFNNVAHKVGKGNLFMSALFLGRTQVVNHSIDQSNRPQIQNFIIQLLRVILSFWNLVIHDT